MKKLALVLLIILKMQFIVAQEINIGNIILPTYTDKKTAVVLDGKSGKYNGVITLPDQFFMTNVDKKNNKGYLLTRNNIYQIDLKKAVVLDSLIVFERKSKGAKDLIDPNLYFVPFYVNKKGIAFYGSMDVKSGNYNLYRCDFNTKKVENFDKIALGQNFAFYDDKMAVFNKNQLTIKSTDTFETIKVIDNVLNNEQQKNAKNLLLTYQGNLVTFNFYPDIDNKYSFVFSLKTNKIIDSYVTTDKFTVDIYLDSCEKNYFSKTSCNNPPMPAQPTFPQLKGFSKKKKAEWQEQVDKINADFNIQLQEWTNLTIKGVDCKIVIYEGEDKTKEIINLPDSRYGTLYYDRYLLINRVSEAELVDIKMNKSLWKSDIDF